MKIDEQKVYEKYDKRCAYCGTELQTIKDMHKDHIVAKSFGGDDSIENRNPSCKYCNNYKGNWSLEEFRHNLLIMLNERHDYLFKSKCKMKVGINLGCLTLIKWDGKFYFERSEK